MSDDSARPFRESLALDTAYLKRGVPAAIDALAAQAMEEVEHARDNPQPDGDAGTTDDEAVL
uniref:Uncharacterized protein n=1 Tax=viral metagenome TaxID=1070528 RepID=A0A6H1ZQY9_9ZZZZ